jgi:glycosyltransferase involved in cell wall biosynthesis
VRALHLSTRLAGSDGVSLESAKLAAALERRGLERVDCAGEVAFERAHRIPAMHFRDPVALDLGARAFTGTEPDPQLDAAIEARAAEIEASILAVIREVDPALLVIQNAWAIPMQLPLALALASVVAETGLPCLSHEHDYWWERERFAQNRVPQLLDRCFPFDAPNVRHLSINGPARAELHRRRGIAATLLPNVFDFATPAPGIDPFNRDLREAAGIGPERRLFLQPTRVVPRKGIELAIDLLAELADPRDVLVISHEAGDEGYDYLHHLERHADDRGVELLYLPHLIAEERSDRPKRYTLWDAYPHADFVTYPSLYEGFGNALLETIYFNRAALVNRYGVYTSDIAPKGFRFVEIDGEVTPAAVAEVARLLDDEAARRAQTDHNYALALEHYSLQALDRIVAPLLADLGVA